MNAEMLGKAVPAILQKQAALLGLPPAQVFLRVTLPLSRLGLAVALSIAWVRAIGEFGAIVIVAGNIPLKSQTAAVYVLSQVESENRQGASAMSVVMLAISLSLVLLVDWLQTRSQKGMAE